MARRKPEEAVREPDDAVMSLEAWAVRCAMSLQTARRLIAAGQGPAVVRLSPGRIGVTFGSHRAWIASRELKPAS